VVILTTPQQRFRASHPEKARASTAKWRSENPEKAKASQKKSDAKRYAANPEKRKAQSAKRYVTNPEKVKAQVAQWQADNPDKVKANAAKGRAVHPEREKARLAQWAIDHPGRNRARSQRRRVRIRNGITEKFTDLEIFERDEWICQLCLEPIDPLLKSGPRRVELDHIRPIAKGGSHTRANVQATHQWCNRSKGSKA
jgi:5-methylcytosine-specific restriction endonuclease McrA